MSHAKRMHGGMTAPRTTAARGWSARESLRRFAIEFSMLGVMLACYLGLRFAMKGDIADAVDNAHRVVRFERAAGLFTEGALQELALNNEGVVRFLNLYYLFAHFSVITVFMVAMFIWRPAGYRVCRRALISMTAMGLLIHALYPLAPPRMLSEFGFIDTGRLFGPSPYTSTSKGLANQFAAMPSLHFGWALLVAWGALRFARGRWRYVAILHPLLTLAAIIITANHYWIDAGVALVIFLAAIGIDWRLRTRWQARRQRASAPASDESAASEVPVAA